MRFWTCGKKTQQNKPSEMVGAFVSILIFFSAFNLAISQNQFRERNLAAGGG